MSSSFLIALSMSSFDWNSAMLCVREKSDTYTVRNRRRLIDSAMKNHSHVRSAVGLNVTVGHFTARAKEVLDVAPVGAAREVRHAHTVVRALWRVASYISRHKRYQLVVDIAAQ